MFNMKKAYLSSSASLKTDIIAIIALISSVASEINMSASIMSLLSVVNQLIFTYKNP